MDLNHRANTYYVDGNLGSDDQSGLTLLTAFKSIKKAADQMQAGDICLIREGVYREKIVPRRGGSAEDHRITYAAYPEERPIITGAEPVVDWQGVGGGVWKKELPDSFFVSSRYNPFLTVAEGAYLSNPEGWTLGMVYYNGVPFSERKFLSECKGNLSTWYSFHKNGITTVFANFGCDPALGLAEVNVREACFEPDTSKLGYINLRGLTLKQAAPQWNGNGQTQQGIITARWANRWVIENCHISDSPCAGISLAYDERDPLADEYTFDQYGFNTVRDCCIERCGQAGIDGLKVGHSARIEGNLIQDINWQQKFDGAEQAGIKLHLAVDAVIKNNIIRRVYGNNEAVACIWLDWANQGVRISGNVLCDFYGYGRDNFILYLEANAGPILIDNNIIIGSAEYKNVVKLGCFNCIFTHNLVSGCEVEHYFDVSRSDPWLLPHSLAVSGRTGPDFPSRHINLNNLYLSSSVNIIHSSNIHLNGKVDMSDIASGVQVILAVNEDFLMAGNSIVDSHSIGLFHPMNQSIEDKAGCGIVVDTDIQGKPRGSSTPRPGPFEDSKDGENTHRIQTAISGDKVSLPDRQPRNLRDTQVRKPAILFNPSFQGGTLDGWQTSGDIAAIQAEDGRAEHFLLKLGPNSGSIRQTIRCTENTLYNPVLKIKTVGDGIGCKLTIRYYDLNLARIGPEFTCEHFSTEFEPVSRYHLSPAGAAYLEVCIEKLGAAAGYVYVDDIKFTSEIHEFRPPLLNIDEYMTPFLRDGLPSSKQYNETVLLYSENGLPASGRLLFKPGRIISVKDYSTLIPFQPDIDFKVEGKIITRRNDSSMSYRKDRDFTNQKYDFYRNIQGAHVVITYEVAPGETWEGPSVTNKSHFLPKTIDLLSQHKPITIVAHGDSITFGHNTSNNDNLPPYMPPWTDLFVDRLGLIYDHPAVRLINTGLPGATCEWGATEIEHYVLPHNPDLVTICFGMNDHWQTDPQDFEAAIHAMIAKIQAHSADTEIILVSSMMYDIPINPDGVERMHAFNRILEECETHGIVLAPMYEISRHLFSRKKPKDCLANPLHPNDYLARWFAQTLITLLDNRG